jgi:hypothetical protein
LHSDNATTTQRLLSDRAAIAQCYCNGNTTIRQRLHSDRAAIAQ